jgi:hypothetical protein
MCGREKDSEEGKAKVLARRAANLEFPCEVEGCGRTFLYAMHTQPMVGLVYASVWSRAGIQN